MKKTILAALSCLLCNSFFAQQINPKVVNSSGGNLSAGSVQLSFNVGEVAVTKISNTNNIITQGFLQPDANSTGIKENNSYSFEAYPNPTDSKLTIQSGDYKEAVYAKLIDGMGRVMYSGEVKNNSLSMDPFTNGIYQLILSDKEQKIIGQKTIIKIN
jgi:hypothetical protein